MYTSLKKKRQDFANKIRSQSKQSYFEKQRKKLLQAQKEGDFDLQGQIFANLIGIFGSEMQVQQVLKLYDEYEKSREEYEQKVEEDQEASINFQRLQQQRKLEKEKEELLALFRELDEDEEPKNEIKDVEI